MILVTGGTGLLGSHLLYTLLKEGHRVRALHRPSSDLGAVTKVFSHYQPDVQSLTDKLEWFEADLLDIVSLKEAFWGVTEVYHCAAIVTFSGSNPETLIRTNTLMTANVVNAALDSEVKKLVHVSSVAALGRSKTRREIDEKARWVEGKENSAYAKSKYLAELEVWRAMEEGLNAVIVVPSIILGPGDWHGGSSNIFHKIARGFKFYTHGVTGYVDVRDVVQAMRRLMKSDISGERFLTVSENKSYKEVFAEIAKCMGVKGPNIEAKPWMGAVVWRLVKLKTTLFGGSSMVTRETVRTSYIKSFYNSGKIRKRLGFEFRTVNESIRDICEFYKKDNS